MKKILFLLTTVFALGITTASSQEKGDKYIGGNMRFAVSSTGSNGYMSTGTYFSIAPEFGYFITDKVKVGGEISYEFSSNAHVIAVAPNIAYYQPIIDKLYYTPQLSIGGGVGIYSGYEAGIFNISLNLASFEYRATTKFGISAGLVNLNYSLIDRTDSFNLGILYSPSIGFHYYF